jgi:hypothetical protein
MNSLLPSGIKYPEQRQPWNLAKVYLMGVRPHESWKARSTQATPVHRRGDPGQLGQEEPEPLDGRGLRPHDRLAPDQPGQGLVAITGQQQPLQVLPKAALLGERAEEIVELDSMSSRGPGPGGQARRLVMAALPPLDRCTAEAALNKLLLEGDDHPKGDSAVGGRLITGRRASGCTFLSARHLPVPAVPFGATFALHMGR